MLYIPKQISECGTYSFKEKYSIFLITIIGSIVILSIPLIVNQILQADFFHVVIHQISFILAAFLTIMAGIGYKKSKMTRMLFSSFGFAALAFGQAVFMYVKIFEESDLENVSASESILDFSILIMTILFAVGVFYKKN